MRPANALDRCISRDSMAFVDAGAHGHESYWTAITKALEHCGVNSLFYGFVGSVHDFSRPDATKICHYRTNHSREWVAHFGEDSLIDNDVTASKSIISGEDVIWHDTTVWADASTLEREQASIERDMGLHVGVTLSLTSGDTSPVYSAVGLSMRDVSERDFEAHWQATRASAMQLLQAYELNLFNTSNIHHFIGLTPRETEFLTLLASGLSQRQIAEKWCRSVDTLDKHSRNSRNKLRALTLEQAVYKAFLLKLISP